MLLHAVVVLAGSQVLAACGGATIVSKHSIQPIVTSSSNGLLSWHGLPDPGVIDTSLGLLFTWVTSPLGQAPVREELALIDGTTGQVKLEREFNATILNATAASGSLFVTTRSAIGEGLVRLNPRNLAETGNWKVIDSGVGFFGRGSLAYAGGALWVAGGDRLDRLSLSRDVVTASIALPGAASSDVATDSTGSVLVVSEANSGGIGHIERRDPMTGALLGVSPQIEGIVDPYINGIVGDDLWVDEATGTMGFSELYDLADLEPVGLPCNEGMSSATCLVGTNGIKAQLIDGLLWVTQAVGGPTRNFCGDPDGQVLATIPVPDDDYVLAIRGHEILLLTPQPAADKGETVTEEPFPNGCKSVP